MVHFFSADRGPDDPLDLLVVCAPGLEELCAVECAEVVGEHSPEPRIEPGGIACRGAADLISALNREVGSALQVLLRLDVFGCHHLRDFDQRLRRLPWGRLFEPGTKVAVKAVSKRSKLYHTGALEERLQRVLTEVTGADAPGDDDAGAEIPHPKVRIRVLGDEVTLSLDTSGRSLDRRGFRLQVSKAPLREDLAWAMVRASGWDPGRELLLDPFCGSGSIPIHAALFATGRPPNAGRRFAYERTRLAIAAPDSGGFEPLGEDVLILGSDRDHGAISASKANAERAGVASDCRFDVSSFSDAFDRAVAQAKATGRSIRVVTNPPFGLRVSGKKRSDLPDLYRALGARIRGSEHVVGGTILSADPALTRCSGLDLSPAFSVRAGGLPVVLLRFGPLGS